MALMLRSSEQAIQVHEVYDDEFCFYLVMVSRV